MRLSLRKAARSVPEPPSCTGNPGKRSSPRINAGAPTSNLDKTDLFFPAYGVDPHRNLLLEVETFPRKEFFLSLTLFVFAGNIGRRLRNSLPRNRQRRCKGCGRKDLLGIAEQTMQSGNQLRVATGKLCADCQRLVDRLRQDDRITAVFIFSRGNETKYYAAFRNSARGSAAVRAAD
jgi:hypothetical protein